MHGDILMSNTTAGTYASQARSPQQGHHFRGEPARGGTRRESFHAIGGVARFFQQLALRRGCGALAQATRLVADDARRQLNGSGMHRDTILFNQQKFLVVGNRDNNGRAGCANAIHILPAAFSYERQEFAAAKRDC